MDEKNDNEIRTVEVKYGGCTRMVTTYNGKAAENHPYKNYPKLIVHSTNCLDDNCEIEGCSMVKKDFIHHFDTCHELRFNKPCVKCEQTVAFSVPHAYECIDEGFCLVPWCVEIKYGLSKKNHSEQNLAKENVRKLNKTIVTLKEVAQV